MNIPRSATYLSQIRQTNTLIWLLSGRLKQDNSQISNHNHTIFYLCESFDSIAEYILTDSQW